MKKKTHTAEVDVMVEAVRQYADRRQIEPATVLQYALSAGSDRFKKPASGEADMMSRQIKRVFDYMSENP